MKSRNITSKKKKRVSRQNFGERGYRQLADFRYAMRQFLAFSESAAHKANITSQQHQALLAIKGLCASGPVSISDIADRLLTRHHSAVELIDRLAKRKLVKRVSGTLDRRRVFVSLTSSAEQLLESLSSAHLQELQRMRPQLRALLKMIDSADRRSASKSR